MNEAQAQPAIINQKERGILVLSRKFSVMSMNSACQAIFGFPISPGETLPLHRLFGGEDLLKVSAAVNSVFSFAGRIAGVPVFGSAGDHSVACELTINPLIGAGREVIGILLFFSPIDPFQPVCTDKNDRPAFAGFEALYNHLPKGSFTIDEQWRISAFNKAAEEITGFSREEALGSHCWDIFRSDMCHSRCPMRMAIDRRQPELDRQVTSINRKGVRLTLSVNVNLLKNENGQVVGAIETFHSAATLNSSPFTTPGRMHGIIGNTPAMRALFEKLADLANSSVNVLILGESGTGKELVARTLHGMSKNDKAPFVAVNCAALPETLIESELFGQEKGAFTGASMSRAGRFEMAGKGTLLLDEIGELKPDLQVKLLRVIEQRAFERVGGCRSIKFQARLISATHQDPASAIREKRFREDLYYRLRTVTLTVPPLRDRKADIPLLVDCFIKQFNAKTGKQVRSLDPKVMDRFMVHHWPGNVRELQRCIEHAFVFVKGPVIFAHYLPEFEGSAKPVFDPVAGSHGQGEKNSREDILQALHRANGRKKAAADLLGISRTSMWRRLKAIEADRSVLGIGLIEERCEVK